jgi:hypothetical protein
MADRARSPEDDAMLMNMAESRDSLAAARRRPHRRSEMGGQD